MKKGEKITEVLPPEVESFIAAAVEWHEEAYRRHIRMLRRLWGYTRNDKYDVQMTRPEILSIVTSLNRKRRGLQERHEHVYAKAIRRARPRASGEQAGIKHPNGADPFHINGVPHDDDHIIPAD